MAEFETRKEFEDSNFGQDIKSNFNVHRNRGNTVTYLCKYSYKKKGFNCSVEHQLVKFAENRWIFERSSDDNQHNHEKVDENRKNNVYNQADSKIKELLQLQVPAKQIKKELISKNLLSPEVSRSEFNQKLCRERAKLKFSNKKMTVDELRNFALEKSKKPNDSWETGDGDELRYNLLISFERLVKCFLSENESRWMLTTHIR